MNIKDIFDLAGGNDVITIIYIAIIVVIGLIIFSNFGGEKDNPEVKEMIPKTKNLLLLVLQWAILISVIVGLVKLIIWIKNEWF